MTWGSEASMKVSDVYALRMKNKMKELDPRAFSDEEKQAFDEAGAAEWKQWLASGSVALVPTIQESSIPKDNNFWAQMSGQSSPRSQENCSPGRWDPQLCLCKTNATTSSGLAVM